MSKTGVLAPLVAGMPSDDVAKAVKSYEVGFERAPLRMDACGGGTACSNCHAILVKIHSARSGSAVCRLRWLLALPPLHAAHRSISLSVGQHVVFGSACLLSLEIVMAIRYRAGE
eukprot:1157361-Pelagomonas_calceolata.AAC.5